jgi:hypothetical protein
MTMLIRTITAVVASAMITTSALAQSARTIHQPTPPVAFQNAPLAKPTVEPIEDAQQQARDLLAGAVNRPATIAHRSVGDHGAPYLDPLEQARRLILGTPHFGDSATSTTAPTVAELPTTNRRTYSDPQESARRMILGAKWVDTPIHTHPISAALRGDARR